MEVRRRVTGTTFENGARTQTQTLTDQAKQLAELVQKVALVGSRCKRALQRRSARFVVRLQRL